MSTETLSKGERLNAKKQIEDLFRSSNAYGKNPFRIIWKVKDVEDEISGVKILVAVPKRKVKKAVQRNRIKRMVREVYRRNKKEINTFIKNKNKECHMGILFVGNPMTTFDSIEKCISDLLKRFPLEYERFT